MTCVIARNCRQARIGAAFPDKTFREIAAFEQDCRIIVRELLKLPFESNAYKKAAGDFIKRAHAFGFSHQVPECGLDRTCWIDDYGQVELSLSDSDDILVFPIEKGAREQ